jgi:hypothetical protein
MIQMVVERVKQTRDATQGAPSKAEWFASLVVCLLNKMIDELESLRAGVQDASASRIAWASRNILELTIHVKFVLLDASHAKEYVNDMWIDGIQIFESYLSWAPVLTNKLNNELKNAGLPESPPPSMSALEETIARFKTLKTEAGVTKSTYLHSQQMANEVGMSEEYKHLNKIASKLVHPTAYSVLASPVGVEVEAIEGMCAMLSDSGVGFAAEAVVFIDGHVAEFGLEPRPSH